MKISKAHMQGYRCLQDLRVDFDDLTALVGSGGVGKSTVLNALDWFFRGGSLDERDRHRSAEENAEPVEEVVVAVTFGDLTAADKEVLGDYVDGTSSTLTRSWSEADGEKLSGTALAFPGFQEMRTIDGARDFRNAYVEIFDDRGEELDLPAPARGTEQIKTDIEVWEREHTEHCQLMAKDARHLFGFAGTATLASRFDYVLVSATASAPQALSDDRRSGTLVRLLSVLEGLDEAAQEQIEKLQADAQGEIEQVVSEARGAELVSISSGLTGRVRDYFPGAAIKLEDEISPPRSPEISVRALVSDRGGHPVAPDLQGHGLQRALVIALLHEIAERESQAGIREGEEDSEPRTLMLTIEEPELYQHPLQARALAATLENLAGKEGSRTIQVAYSTHSPYFSRPALFADLRLCRRRPDGTTSCVAADAEKITEAIAAVDYGSDVTKNVEKALADSLGEAIFARSVLLCEGDTDAALLEGIGDMQGGLDADGVAVAPCGSKPKMVVAIAILDQLDIPFVALFDADAKGQDSSQAKRNRQILELCGEEPTDWPERALRKRSANFADTLESDLASLWPEFSEARERVAAELALKPGKKDDRVYRQAAAEAGQPPDFLLDLLDAARKLAE
jgi:hypothetical protein